MEQTLINSLFGVVSAILGWILKVVWDSLKALKEADDQLASKVAAIEVLVAGKYVTREEFYGVVDQLHAKMDKILEALNRKADRR